jgi:methionine sulfoxide reductase heme-binding subunit
MQQADLWYVSRATGVVALVLLTATTFLGVLVAGRAKSKKLPSFARADAHRYISAVTVAFVAVHVVTALLDPYVNIGWAAAVLPLTSSYERAGIAIGTVGADVLLAVGISSALRTRLPARVWRAVHWAAYLCWPTAVAHALAMGPDTRFAWARCLVAACAFVVLGAVVWRVAGAVNVRSARPRTELEPRRSLLAAMSMGDATK